MKYLKSQLTTLALSFSTLIACDPADPNNGNSIPDNSCIVIPGLPDSGEYYVACPDGAKTRLQVGEEEQHGCTVSDNGNGTSTLACPDGTSGTFSTEDVPTGAGCQGLQTMDPVLGYCIPWLELQFTGTISEASIADLPAAMTPNSTTTCEGRIAFPTGLSPATFGSAGDGFFSGNYVFGHNSLYGIEMTVDNVVFQRDGRFSVPDSVNYITNYEANIDGSGTITTSSKTSILSGFAPLATTSLELSATKMIAVGDDFSMGLPTTAGEWTSLEAPQIIMNYDDFSSTIPTTASITCDVAQFTEVPASL